LPAGSIVAGTAYTIRVEFITNSTFDILVDGVRYDNAGAHYRTVSDRTTALTNIRVGGAAGATTCDVLVTDLRASWLTQRLLPHDASRDVRNLPPFQQHHQNVITIDYEEVEKV
jgi:hypothetical protein